MRIVCCSIGRTERAGGCGDARSGIVSYDHTVAPVRAALLIMDVQPEIVERFDAVDVTDRLAGAAIAARAAGVKVVYVKVGFRPGYPEISPRNSQFARLAQADAFLEGISSTLHPNLSPQPDDVIVTKHRVSAFAGTDLDMLLRAGEIGALVLAGIATSGCVLSTLRQAADLDYSVTVLSDGCLDSDAEVHRVLCEKVFPRQADVLTVDEWIGRLG
jgi:nicotinamidase-related amidase